jgi:hypothetical protein
MEADSELTVEKIAEVATPDQAHQMETFTTSEMPTNVAEFMPLREFFGIQDMDRKTQEQLENVWQFFSKDAKNPGEVLKKIKAKQMTIAKPGIGDTTLNQLNNYVRILQQLEQVKDMKEAYEQ